MNVFCSNHAHAHWYGMDFRDLVLRTMSAAGLTQESLATKLGVSQATVSRWVRATDPSEPYYSHYSKILALAEQFALVPPRAGAVSVPLISWVSAGELAAADGVESISDARRIAGADLDPTGDWIALEVVGDSMDRISPPGSIIFVNRRDRKLVTNACYVIADENGGASYKRFRAGPERWEPVSTNPDHEPFFVQPGGGPVIVGRVKQSRILM